MMENDKKNNKNQFFKKNFKNNAKNDENQTFKKNYEYY